MNKDEVSQLHSLVEQTLEEARLEAVRLFRAIDFPLSATINQTVVRSRGDGNGWQSDQAQIQVSGFYFDTPITRLRVASMSSGDQHYATLFGNQVSELAEYLNDKTNLGVRPASFLPSLQGTEAIKARYLDPLIYRYLRALHDLEKGELQIVTECIEELDDFLAQDASYKMHQLALGGIAPEGKFSHRGVTLRSLSPAERGAFLERDSAKQSLQPVPRSSLIIPRAGALILPSAVLTITTTNPLAQIPVASASTLPSQLALSFFLSDYDISGTGTLASFDDPFWASSGVQSAPFPLAEKITTRDKPIPQDEFIALVDLAYRMPSFSGTEGNSKEIALFRALRGFGMHWHESGFLDFAIALEAALLSGIDTELAYRFRLYGALFLREKFDVQETFKQLNNIYRVRSKLVHGGKISSSEVSSANNDAPRLAKAVVHKAIDSGWPDAKTLDAAALEIGMS